MPGISALVDLISLDVTRGLVQQGLGLGFDGKRYTRTGSPAHLAITNATNASPIVITCDRPHAIPPLRANGKANTLHAIVDGVEGNTAANAVDTEKKNRTVGLNLGVALVPLTATTFAMYRPDPATGLLAPLAGNGAYTTGGTITPALTDGRIHLGQEYASFDNTAAPVIVFVPPPTGTRFGAKSVAHAAVRLTHELNGEIVNRALLTEWTAFHVHTWGVADRSDTADDFDITQRMYQQVIQSAHLTCSGVCEFTDGSWFDQSPKETQRVKYGHYQTMMLRIGSPVLEFAMPLVVPPITISPTTYYQPPDGSPPQVGCSG